MSFLIPENELLELIRHTAPDGDMADRAVHEVLERWQRSYAITDIRPLLESIRKIADSAAVTYSKDISDWHDDMQTIWAEAEAALGVLRR